MSINKSILEIGAAGGIKLFFTLDFRRYFFCLFDAFFQDLLTHDSDFEHGKSAPVQQFFYFFIEDIPGLQARLWGKEKAHYKSCRSCNKCNGKNVPKTYTASFRNVVMPVFIFSIHFAKSL